jgi:hypothetical protein
MKTLPQLPSGEWAVQAPGREPVRIVAGGIFSLEVGRCEMGRARAEQRGGQWLAVLIGVRDERSERRVKLRDGLGASFFDRRECTHMPNRGTATCATTWRSACPVGTRRRVGRMYQASLQAHWPNAGRLFTAASWRAT